MNFLNPSILFGLFAVSIPILIHLLNLRKIRKVEFSTLMFLKEIQKSKMRRIKLRQLLLLLLRMMAIIFLVFCFAKPVYEGFAGNNENSGSSTVLIFLDDSFSMAARDNNGQYLSQAKDAVKKIVESHRESDDIYFIPVSHIGFKNSKILFDSFKELLDTLEKTRISYKPARVNDIFNYSEQILNDSKKSDKEIFIVSDFQSGNFDFQSLSSSGINNFKDKSVNKYLIKTGNRSVSNLSLDSFIVVSKIIEKDKDIKIKIYLTNHSQFNVKNKTINLYIDNVLKGERVIDVNSFDKSGTEFLFKSDHSGSLNGMLELVQSEFQDDEIIQDNKYYFSMYIPDKFNIGLIGNSEKDTYFLKLALQAASNLLSDSLKRKSELFNISTQTAVDENISKNNVVFVSNKKNFTDNEAGILKDYISNGGGVFLFLGNAADINNYNSTLLSKLNAARIEVLNSNADANRNLKFDKIDFENPLLSEIFLNQKLNLTSGNFNVDSPDIKFYYELIPSENANSIINLNNNKPFLLESKISKGKIIISSVSATDDFSDLPFRSIFVPLIIRSIYYLSNNFEYQKEYTAGSSNLIQVQGLKSISELVLPDKNIIKSSLELNKSKENYLFLPYSENIADVGIYTLKDSSGSGFNFPINKNSAESNLTYLTKEELIDYFKRNGIENVKYLESNENISESVKESKTGFSLWKYFLIGSILFVIAEIFLSKRIEEG